MPTGMKMVVKQLIDQPLHLLWGGLSQFPLLLAIAKWGVLDEGIATIAAGVGAFVMCMPRELVDQWPIVRKWDFVLDVCMFTLGGAIAGYLTIHYLAS